MWKLDNAIAIKAAVVRAIEDAAILANVRRRALARAEAVADAFRLSRKEHQLVVREPARGLPSIDSIVTTVRAVLIVIGVVAADGAGAGDIRTVYSEKARIAVTEAVRTDAIPGTVMGAIVHVQHPKVTKDRRRCITGFHLRAVAQSAVCD